MKSIILHRPVVLSYFSQSGDTNNGFLPFLEAEYESITEAWEQYQIQVGSDRYITVDFPSRFSADGNRVAKDIRDYKDRIILFHFSGHASSKNLLFKDGASHAFGIAGLLGGAPNLKLVVLNGCATYDQVNLLFENKVKVVIATKGRVNDGIARKFAETFYKALSTTTYTIQSAYTHALNELKREHDNLGSVSTEPIIWRGLETGLEDDRDRWELYVMEECKELIDDPNWWRIGNPPSSHAKPATLLSPKGVDNPNVFIGRKEELETIRERLVKSGKLMLINAEGGIGKTTLAARYWHESLYEYQHNAWLFCGNGVMNALKELAPKLNVDLVGLNEVQQFTALRHVLSQIHDNFLLVLDNANDEEDIRAFRKEFEGFHWHVLITSRCQGAMEKEQELTITHLPQEQAKKLFEEYYAEGTPDFDALLDRLLKAIDYHTLLVEVFAKNLHEASELGSTLADFMQKLETEGLYLGEDSFEIQTRYTDYVQKAAATTDDILDILYDFSKLSGDQRYLLVNLALLPPESYTMLFLAEVMAPADKKAFYSTLKSLYQKGWVGGSNKTYRISPVVQGLVLKKNQDALSADAEAMLINLAEKMDNEGGNFKFLHLPEIAPLARLASMITQNLVPTPTFELSSLNFNAGIYFENTGDVVQAILSFGKFGEVSAMLGDKANVSVSYSKLGDIYEAIGNWKNALENYQEYNRLSLEIYQSSPVSLQYKSNLAVSYSKMGSIHEATGKWKDALENYQEDLRITKEVYQSSPENLQYKNNLAVSYSKVGTLFLQQKEVNVSLNHFLQGQTLFTELWKATQGQIVQYTFHFAMSSRDVSRIVKWKILNRNYKSDTIPKLAEQIKELRREGHSALQLLAEKGSLHQNQLALLQELADESWYEF